MKNAEGVGKVKVMLMEDGGQGVYSSGETEVTGVLIVAEGADNAVTYRFSAGGDGIISGRRA